MPNLHMTPRQQAMHAWCLQSRQRPNPEHVLALMAARKARQATAAQVHRAMVMALRHEQELHDGRPFLIDTHSREHARR